MNEDWPGQSVRGWNRVSSHFDVWRQPPIMESIIARHSLSFCVPFSMANQAARLSVSRRIQPPLPFLQNPVGHQNLSLSSSLPLFLSLLSVLVGKKKKTYYTGRNCSYYTGRKGVTEDRFHERSDQSRLRSTRVYKNAAIIVI